MARTPVETLLRGLPHNELTPLGMGDRLFAAFSGYSRNAPPLEQLAWMLRNNFVSPDSSGFPQFVVTSLDETDSQLRWLKNSSPTPPASAEFSPSSLDRAFDVITVSLENTPRAILVARSAEDVIPFFYIKGETPVVPKQIINLRSVWDILTTRPEDDSATIQLWKRPDAQKDVYHLQGALALNNISLLDFVTIMRSRPDQLQRAEAAAQKRSSLRSR